MAMIEKLHNDLNPEKFSKLSQVIDNFCSEHAQLPAFTCLGRTLDYSEVNELSDRFAHYLITQTSLKPGDRIAIQLPNILQFPIAFFGATRAGLIVVNTNPLYTAQEMAHQFKDSGVKGIVILSNFCDKLEKILPETEIETIIVTQIGDIQKPFKRHFLNLAMKYIRRLVPAYSLKNTANFQSIIDTEVPEFDYP